MPKIVFDPNDYDVDALRNSAVVVHYPDGGKLAGHVSACIPNPIPSIPHFRPFFQVTDRTGKTHDLDIAAIRNGEVIVVFNPTDKLSPEREEEGLNVDMFR